MTLFNGPTYFSANGGVMVFDGADDYAKSSGFSISNYTVEMFVNVYQIFSSVPRIFEGNSNAIVIALGSGGAFPLNNIHLYVDGSGWINTSYTLTLGQYTHITLVKNAALHQVFVNGISIYSSTLVNNTLSGFTLASPQNSISDEKTRSTFGYFKIYNKVLSSQEVLSQYNFNKSRYGL